MLKDSVTGVPTVSRPSADLARRGHVTGAALRAAKMLGSGRPQPGRVGWASGSVLRPRLQPGGAAVGSGRGSCRRPHRPAGAACRFCCAWGHEPSWERRGG